MGFAEVGMTKSKRRRMTMVTVESKIGKQRERASVPDSEKLNSTHLMLLPHCHHHPFFIFLGFLFITSSVAENFDYDNYIKN